MWKCGPRSECIVRHSENGATGWRAHEVPLGDMIRHRSRTHSTTLCAPPASAAPAGCTAQPRSDPGAPGRNDRSSRHRPQACRPLQSEAPRCSIPNRSGHGRNYDLVQTVDNVIAGEHKIGPAFVGRRNVYQRISPRVTEILPNRRLPTRAVRRRKRTRRCLGAQLRRPMHPCRVAKQSTGAVWPARCPAETPQVALCRRRSVTSAPTEF